MVKILLIKNNHVTREAVTVPNKEQCLYPLPFCVEHSAKGRHPVSGRGFN